MTLLHHARLVLRLVPVVLSLWWADLREPGAAIRILRAVVARSPERTAILRAHVTHGAVASAIAGSYSLIALTVRDRLEAL